MTRALNQSISESFNQSEAVGFEPVTDEDDAAPPLPPGGIPLKNEAASPRQIGQVRLDCKKNMKIINKVLL